jgi:peroxiredoxin
MKKYVLLFTTVMLLAISCNSSDDAPVSDPKELFIKANQSSLDVKDATFKTKLIFESPKENFTTEVLFTLMRDKDAKTGFIVRFKTDDGEGLYDGEKYYYKSDNEKKVYISGEGIEPDMFITQNWIINPITMIMLDKDYTKEINERKDELFMIGDAKFSTYQTNVVETIISTDDKTSTKIRTYFDKATNLPIKEVKITKRESDNIVQTFELTELKINKGLSKSDFKMATAEGYAEEIITPQSEPKAANEGGPAPDFTLKDINGKDVTLSKLKGKVVVLDFWGTWCHWCVKAMPKLQNVHEHFKGKNVVVLGISCSEREGADPKKFMIDNKVTYNSVLLGDQVAQSYGVTGFPTLYVIGKDGNIIHSKSGFAETMDKDLIELITKNL